MEDASVNIENAATAAELAPAAPPHSTPAELVDALNLVFGKQTDNRAVHAKGRIILQGKFIPNSEAKNLSRALHFRETVPVTVRFSNFAGVPTISDTDGGANPRGMALKFHLPDGSETDLVTHSFNGFPAPTADEFRQFLIALGTSGKDAAKPTPIEKYLAAHPVAKTFLETQESPPKSYATLCYFGVNSFKFTNEEGKSIVGRYRIEPQAGKEFLSLDEIAGAAPNYLSEEIQRRVAESPIQFNFRLQLAESSDAIENPSIAWADENKIVDLGVIEIASVADDSIAAEHALLFLPALLPDGIEPADPMIRARSNAYPISYDRRHQ